MRVACLLCLILGASPGVASMLEPPDSINDDYALALWGEAKYATGFRHFDYANPAAPKGGSLRLAVIGRYDNFNPYAESGLPARRSARLFDTLFTLAEDETASAYPLIGSAIRHNTRFSWAEITLNPRARFQDHTPITAADVAFSFHTLMQQGPATFRQYFTGITLRAITPLTVHIGLPSPDKVRLLALLTRLPILPRQDWYRHRLDQPRRTPPIGSGPYRIIHYRLGHSVTYQRLPDYWAADLPVNRGRYNIDTLHYTYYPDRQAVLTAFLHDRVDVHLETSPTDWKTRYHTDAVARGDIIRADFRSRAAQATRWLAFNNQLPLFRDRRVRQAISLVLDFAGLNRQWYGGVYQRTDSYFQNTPYAAHGYPDAAELLWLAPLKATLPPPLFLRPYHPPSSTPAAALSRARNLLAQAGWRHQGKWLVNTISGKRFVFTLLLPYGSHLHYVQPLRNTLARLGITLHPREAPPGQFDMLARRHAFGMIPVIYPATPFPSPALLLRWGSRYADGRGNIANVHDGAVDSLLALIRTHQNRPDTLRALGRALDRVLTWQAFMLPLWYSDHRYLAYWNRFGIPPIRPYNDLGLDFWWYDMNRAARLPTPRKGL